MFGKHFVFLFLVGASFHWMHVASASLKNGSILLKWVNVKGTKLADLEPAGSEKNDLNPTIYVARTSHQEKGTGVDQLGIIPGKYVDKRAMFYYTHNGRWYETPNCEVLVYPRGSVSWIPVENIESLDDPVVGGLDPTTNEILRICRLEHQVGCEKHIMPGKLYPSGECKGVYYGDITKRSEYEVLVVNRYGKFISE